MTVRARVRFGLLATFAAVALWVTGPAAAVAANESGTLEVHTVPATEGARVAAEGRTAVTNGRGVARLQVRSFDTLDERFKVLQTRVSQDRRVTLDRVLGSPRHGRSGAPVVVGLRTERLVRWSFVDRGRNPVPADRISLLEMRSNAGEVVQIRGGALQRPRWVAAGRTQQTTNGLVNKPQYWSITRVVVDGADVVNRAQQVFVPDETQDWQIELMFYRVEVVGRDLLFAGPTGKGLAITRPDGVTERLPFEDGAVTIESLPRGTYDVQIYGPGISFTRPMSISKDQVVDLMVISRFNVALLVTVLALVAISLVLVGRRHRVVSIHRRSVVLVGRATESTTVLVVAVFVCTVLLLLIGVPLARADTGTPSASRGTSPPTLAYYYIWYQPTSWQRAKSDYPLLGNYSSDDGVIMRQHVKMAQNAGLSGFLVSWKGRDGLDRRLARLVDISERRDFKLGIVYQGLDFDRNPLPVRKVAADLEKFADTYTDSPAFDLFERPVVVITGTESYSVEDLRRATAPVQGRVLVLASAKSVADYRRTAAVTDGDAYYWSSAHPDRPFYAEKLSEMARAVRSDGGLWLAPAAAGFDARMIGGQQVVPRNGGRTLATAIDVARDSQPDAVAVISWNEFSENSHVEPSEVHGHRELDVLADKLDGRAEVPRGLIEGAGSARGASLTGWGAMVVMLLLGAAANLLLLLRRSRRQTPADATQFAPTAFESDEPAPASATQERRDPATSWH
jgi:hypothetical protein